VTLGDMSVRWRWALVAIIALTVFGGLMPNALFSSRSPLSRPVDLLAQEPPLRPSGCFDASCSKGVPTPATPPLTIAGVCSAIAGLLTYLSVRMTKRIRQHAEPLPRGTSTALFRPPQFS
jgi:hypothetical protein